MILYSYLWEVATSLRIVIYLDFSQMCPYYWQILTSVNLAPKIYKMANSIFKY